MQHEPFNLTLTYESATQKSVRYSVDPSGIVMRDTLYLSIDGLRQRCAGLIPTEITLHVVPESTVTA